MWGRLGRESREQAGGLWYVRNAAKANRKPHTPVSNEINAFSFSGARGKSDREAQSTDETDCERSFSSTASSSWTWTEPRSAGRLACPAAAFARRLSVWMGGWEGKHRQGWQAEEHERCSRNLTHSHTMNIIWAGRWWMMFVCLLLQDKCSHSFTRIQRFMTHIWCSCLKFTKQISCELRGP